MVGVVWVALAAIAMGSLVSIAHLRDFAPPIVLGVGEMILSVSLGVGILLGLFSSEEEIPAVIARGVAASVGAYILILVTVAAPILAGVVPDIASLGGGETVRSAFLTPIFILPLNLLGSVGGRLLGERLKAFSRRPMGSSSKQ